MPRQNVKDLVIFRAGTYRHGNYTEAMLDELVETFNEQAKPAVIIGHSSDYKGHTRIPAFGVINSLKRVGKDLVATSAEFSDKLVTWIKEGFYTDRSVEIGKDKTTGKLKLFALGMLGAAAPEVKGMPSVDASLQEIAMEYSAEAGLVEMSEDANVSGQIDTVEALGKEDTLKAIRESFAVCLSNIENIMGSDAYDSDKLYQELSTCYNDISNELSMHFQFLAKVEQIEEGLEGEMSEKKNLILEFFDKFRTSRKESTVDAQKEKEYRDKIVALEAQVSEFSEEKRKESEAKAKAEADLADANLRSEINEFCEKAGLNTKKYDDMKLKELMFSVAKANAKIEFSEGSSKSTIDVLKEFAAELGKTVAPKGETEQFKGKEDYKASNVIEFAEKHYSENADEFKGLSKKQAVSKILTAITTGKLKMS